MAVAPSYLARNLGAEFNLQLAVWGQSGPGDQFELAGQA
ncbi:hypothetical protein BOO71_0000013 [Deinococcus marmoris]|uniref:Uncharacterized protein n=1 Tax=Deinococcus marmoris TaxID=249408 RepID=A0A1U7P577_9DEIO|nr:hypothetical protein BOO71_0000013 [Deinococcus marmoris]